METDGVDVPGWPDSLDEFERLVERRLGGRVKNLRLEVAENRSIILSGRAPTYHVKQLAQQVALEVLGKEVELANEIVVC